MARRVKSTGAERQDTAPTTKHHDQKAAGSTARLSLGENRLKISPETGLGKKSQPDLYNKIVINEVTSIM